MRDLRRIQKQFQNFILQKKNSIDVEIISSENVSANTRLEIYQDAYYSRLLDALKQDYPVLLALMGDEAFEELGFQYIHAYPSQHRSIRWFSQDFNQFMQKTKPYQDHPWQIEMAKFEWHMMLAFDAPDSEVVMLDEMSMVPFDKWPEMCFQLHPSIQQLDLQWNIVSLWKAYKEENRCMKPERADQSTPWIIWRKDFDIHFNSLTPDERYVLESMLRQDHFSAICEGLCEWVDAEHVANHAAVLLKRFIIDNMIAKIIFN